MHSYSRISDLCGSHDEGKGLTGLSPASVCSLCASKDGRLGSHLQRSSPSGLAFTILSRTRPNPLLAPASVFAPLRERCLVVFQAPAAKLAATLRPYSPSHSGLSTVPIHFSIAMNPHPVHLPPLLGPCCCSKHSSGGIPGCGSQPVQGWHLLAIRHSKGLQGIIVSRPHSPSSEVICQESKSYPDKCQHSPHAGMAEWWGQGE